MMHGMIGQIAHGTRQERWLAIRLLVIWFAIGAFLGSVVLGYFNLPTSIALVFGAAAVVVAIRFKAA